MTNVPLWCREYCQDGLDQGAAGAGQHTQPVRYGDAGAVDGGHGTQPALHRSGGATDAAAATTDDAAAAASNHTRRNCTLLSSHLLPSLLHPQLSFSVFFSGSCLWLCLCLCLSLSLFTDAPLPFPQWISWPEFAEAVCCRHRYAGPFEVVLLQAMLCSTPVPNKSLLTRALTGLLQVVLLQAMLDLFDTRHQGVIDVDDLHRGMLGVGLDLDSGLVPDLSRGDDDGKLTDGQDYPLPTPTNSPTEPHPLNQPLAGPPQAAGACREARRRASRRCPARAPRPRPSST